MRPFREVFPYLTWQSPLPLFKKWAADQCGNHDHSSELSPGLMDEISALCTEKFCSKSLYPGFFLPPCKEAQTIVKAERKVSQLGKSYSERKGLAQGHRAPGGVDRLAPTSPCSMSLLCEHVRSCGASGGVLSQGPEKRLA